MSGYENIPGWMAPEFEDFYRSMAESLPRDARVVEVGCAYGRSMCLLLEELGLLKKSMSIYAVDLWQEFMGQEQPDKAPLIEVMKKNHGTPYEAFIANIREFAPASTLGMMIAIQKASVDAAREFADGSLDFVMIDARHEYESVREDIRAWRPKVRSGGVIAGDDFDRGMFPGLCRAVDEATLVPMRHEGRIWIHEVP